MCSARWPFWSSSLTWAPSQMAICKAMACTFPSPSRMASSRLARTRLELVIVLARRTLACRWKISASRDTVRCLQRLSTFVSRRTRCSTLCMRQQEVQGF
eukprot:9480226-Pyramimonas_sp.AAC.1